MAPLREDTLQLVTAAQEGDPEALERLYERHRGRLLAFVASRMPPALTRAVAAEDIVQETHLESVRKIAAFEPRGPASFYRWLVAIARFKLAEAMRGQRAKKRAHEVALDREPAAGHTSPSGYALRTERARLVADGLRDLPDAQAEAVRLRYLQGLTIAECAERIERSPAAVKALVSRGLGALAATLTRTPD